MYDFRRRPVIYDAVTLQTRTNSLRGNPWMFTGQRYDAATGLYYYKARFYDPGLGVFLSRDPAGTWHDRMNLGNGMAYVGLGTFNRRDPSGLKLCVGGGDSKAVQDAIHDLCPNVIFDAASGCFGTGNMKQQDGHLIVPGPGGHGPVTERVKFEVSCQLLWDIINDTSTVMINVTDEESEAVFDWKSGCKKPGANTVDVNWNPDDWKIPRVKLKQGQGFIVLAHELIHARHALKGTIIDQSSDDKEHGSKRSSGEENTTVGEEDKIRDEHGIGERKTY